MPHFYDLLQISPTASDEEIRQAIGSQLRVWNQRTNSSDTERRNEADKMCQLLYEAERTLLSPEQRMAYNQQVLLVPTSDATDSKLTDQIQDLLRRAKWALQESNHTEALECALAVTKVMENQAEAWGILGQARLELGRMESAIQALVRACDLDPTNNEYIYLLGLCHEKQREYRRAEEQYRQVLKNQVENRAMERLGHVLLLMDREAEGIPFLEQVYNHNPQYDSLRELLTKAYLKLAFRTWQEVSEGHPFLESGKYPTHADAVSIAEKSLQTASKFTKGYSSLDQMVLEAKHEIETKTGWVFTGSWMVAGIMFVLLGATAWIHQNWLYVVLFIALPLLYISTSFTPRYLVYHQMIRGDSGQRDLQYVRTTLSRRLGWIGFICLSGLLIYLIYFIPWILLFLVGYNIKRNFL